MALWICNGCTSAYAVGLPACPHCGRTDYHEDYEVLPAQPVSHPGPQGGAASKPVSPAEPEEARILTEVAPEPEPAPEVPPEPVEEPVTPDPPPEPADTPDPGLTPLVNSGESSDPAEELGA